MRGLRGALRTVRLPVVLGVAACVSILGLGGAGAVCRFALDCHVRHHAPSLDDQRGNGLGRTWLPAGFGQELVARVPGYPTDFDFLPDGRMLVADKSGLVWLVRHSGRRTVFLDLRARVDDSLLRGLVAIAVDPLYARDHFVYAIYAVSRAGEESGRPTFARVSRFVALGDTAAPSSERVLVGGGAGCTGPADARDCLPVDGDHLGGDIAFRQDGSLLVATGDGGGLERLAYAAQDTGSLVGKVLRVDRDGRGLPDNPYWNGDRLANRSRVWALGFRNPFRIAASPAGPVYVGDVGWHAWEEIDHVVRGGNYGWPCAEGPVAQPEYAGTRFCLARVSAVTVAPALQFQHVAGNAVVAGVVTARDRPTVPGTRELLVADWGRSWIRAVPLAADGRPLSASTRFAAPAAAPVRLRLRGGDLYYLAASAGELRRIWRER